jgi:hypothetical protein
MISVTGSAAIAGRKLRRDTYYCTVLYCTVLMDLENLCSTISARPSPSPTHPPAPVPADILSQSFLSGLLKGCTPPPWQAVPIPAIIYAHSYRAPG